MLLNIIEHTISKLQNQSLPGKESHIKLAPEDRVKMLKLWEYDHLTPKKAAVLILIYPKSDQLYFTLIERSSHGVHGSQIGLPGGRYEQADQTLEQTAKRETFEELGISEHSIQIIRELTSIYIPPSNFLVHPFVGLLNDEPQFIPSDQEVKSIIEVQLKSFLKLDPSQNWVSPSYNPHKLVPSFEIHNHIVWGATAMILSELKDLLS